MSRRIVPNSKANALQTDISIDIVSYMKTTIDISGSLLQEAKRLSAQRQVTLRSLVEQGLREIIVKQKADQKFKPLYSFLKMISPKNVTADSRVLSVSVMMATPEILDGSSPNAFL